MFSLVFEKTYKGKSDNQRMNDCEGEKQEIELEQGGGWLNTTLKIEMLLNQ